MNHFICFIIFLVGIGFAKDNYETVSVIHPAHSFIPDNISITKLGVVTDTIVGEKLISIPCGDNYEGTVGLDIIATEKDTFRVISSCEEFYSLDTLEYMIDPNGDSLWFSSSSALEEEWDFGESIEYINSLRKWRLITLFGSKVRDVRTIPTNLDDAMSELDIVMDDKEKEFLLSLQIPSSNGKRARWLRYNWRLFKKNQLVLYFNSLGIYSADKMSVEILMKYIQYHSEK